jgi:Zn-dependent protease with chaperone function
VVTTVPPRDDTPGLSWHSLASPAFDKWVGGITAGLLVGWTLAPLVLWVALLSAFSGALSGAVDGATSGPAQTLHIEAGAGFAGAVVGVLLGVLSVVWFTATQLYNYRFIVLGSLFSGIPITLFILWLVVRFEDPILRLRGCRDPSRRERALVDPIFDQILKDMGIVGSRPKLYVTDGKVPAAWTHVNSIVVTQAFLGSYDDSENPPVPDLPPHAFAGVLAHEICHWARADGVGTRAVWACCWPIIGVYNLIGVVGKIPDNADKRRNVKFLTIAWLLFWPFWVAMRLVVWSLAKSMREAELYADARTACLGDEYRIGLRLALAESEQWEAPRTGWEDVLQATHPPIEERLQKLERLAVNRVAVQTPGFTDFIVTDLDVCEAARLCYLAEKAGNATFLKSRRSELNLAIAAWLRTVKHAKEQGQPVDSADSLDVLDARIADYQQKADGVFVTLGSTPFGDLGCQDREVHKIAHRCAKAIHDGDSKTIVAWELDLYEAVLRWLRPLLHDLENDALVMPNETGDGLAVRIAECEQRLAALRQAISGSPATTA